MTKQSEKAYVGTKIIRATPMSSHQHNNKLKTYGPDEPGYRVTYPDGYVSWSPKQVFEECYREISLQEYRMIEEGTDNDQ